jgi:PAS domain S-box-containing protein
LSTSGINTTRTVPSTGLDKINGVGLEVLLEQLQDAVVFIDPGGRVLLSNAEEDAVVATDVDGIVTAWNRGAERTFGWAETEALGRRITDVVGAACSEAEIADKVSELARTGRRRSEETGRRRDGTTVVTDSLTVALHDGEGELTGFLAIARDVTERHRALLELERRIAQQAAVAELGLEALQGHGLGPLIDQAAQVVCRGLGAEYTEVDEVLPGGELCVRAGAGLRQGVVGTVLPAGRESLAGFALLTGGPVSVDDVDAETRFEVPGGQHDHDVMSAVAVVIGPPQMPYGTLAALSTHRLTFSEHDVSFVQSVANVLAFAATGGPRPGESGDEQRWVTLTGALRRVGQQMRGAIYDLGLSTEKEHPFADRLADVVALQEDMAVGLTVQLRGLGALPDASLGEAGTELLRIVREAITNARRHAGASSIRVDARASSGDVVRIQISDDGRWADREDIVAHRRGTGIAGMFDRAERLGADLRIVPGAGGGTCVALEWSPKHRSR